MNSDIHSQGGYEVAKQCHYMSQGTFGHKIGWSQNRFVFQKFATNPMFCPPKVTFLLGFQHFPEILRTLLIVIYVVFHP
jgi:hypothetical protein